LLEGQLFLAEYHQYNLKSRKKINKKQLKNHLQLKDMKQAIELSLFLIQIYLAINTLNHLFMGKWGLNLCQISKFFNPKEFIVFSDLKTKTITF
jgi:hypothetical protein